ncbi:hypothetical protein HPP92_014105 [Vanilla planifolia]|uniref:non-specific serine/threonine protein kinase n=1 Tax=Vanilla planifolia TaxID=51239 RepID=A0A835QQY5_VANPL|nr:hypothetical protein HPP92_014105 [Vanilla planifolia]
MKRRYLSQEASSFASATEHQKGHGGFQVLTVCIVVGASLVGLLLGFLLLLKCMKRKKLFKKSVCCPVTELRQYRFSQVEKATDSFSEERLMGSGAFGKVYKGEFDEDKRTLAIKIAHSESFVSAVEFKNEIELLSRVRHKNLVGLVGYCIEASQKVLVYEYVSNGSLLEYIVGRERRPLTWQQRLNIAIGIARGLAYLHQEVSPGIIHRDVKPSNILIDDEFEPKISDFGLVKKGPLDDTSYVITQVKGTPGYMDPAYCSTCHLTPSSDVYSFGVILLQLVSACPVLDHTRRQSHYHITDWVTLKSL